MEHLVRCAKPPKVGEYTLDNRYVDEDFPPSKFYSEETKYARLQQFYPEGMLFKSFSLENISPHNAINKEIVGKKGGTPFMNAVRMMISAGQESVIKGLFLWNQEQSYQDRINSGLHQVRLYINGEPKVITVDDFVPRLSEYP
jgi:hypothetical protein